MTGRLMYIDGLVQEKRNSSALAMDLRSLDNCICQWEETLLM